VWPFNNPGAVTVRTAPGRRVTVRVDDGRASCVVAGWLNL
jgi:hypothetical protein